MRPPNHILVFCCVALHFGYANHPIHGWSLVIARLCVTLLTVGVCGEGGRWWLVVWLFVLCLWKLELTLAVGRIIQDSMVVIVIVTRDANSYNTRLTNYGSLSNCYSGTPTCRWVTVLVVSVANSSHEEISSLLSSPTSKALSDG